MTRSHNCNLKMCIKGYSFWISRLLGIKQRYSWYPKVFCAWKRGRQKRRYWGKVAKDNSFKSLRMLRYRSWRSSILWRNVLEERREIIWMGFIVFPLISRIPKDLEERLTYLSLSYCQLILSLRQESRCVTSEETAFVTDFRLQNDQHDKLHVWGNCWRI